MGYCEISVHGALADGVRRAIQRRFCKFSFYGAVGHMMLKCLVAADRLAELLPLRDEA